MPKEFSLVNLVLILIEGIIRRNIIMEIIFIVRVDQLLLITNASCGCPEVDIIRLTQFISLNHLIW